MYLNRQICSCWCRIGKTYSDYIRLRHTGIDSAVDRRPGVALQRRTTALASKVHIDREKLVLPIERLPRGSQRFATIRPSRILGVDPARVVLQLGARSRQDNVVGIGAGARVGVAQADHGGVVQVSDADVTARLAAVLIVEGDDVDKGVRGATSVLDCIGEGGEGFVGRDNCSC